jgi:hypothetical protein
VDELLRSHFYSVLYTYRQEDRFKKRKINRIYCYPTKKKRTNGKEGVLSNEREKNGNQDVARLKSMMDVSNQR